MNPTDSSRPVSALSRRAVLTTSAWAAPAVVVASQAPAFASSTDTRVAVPYLLSWSSAALTFTQSVPAQWPFAGYDAYTAVARPLDPSQGAPDIRVNMSSTLSRMQVLSDNMTVSSHHVGGLGHAGLTLAQRLPVSSSGDYAQANSVAYQQLGIAFGVDVTALRLKVTTLDVKSESYSDQIELGTGAVVTPSWNPQSPTHTAFNNTQYKFSGTPSKGVLDAVTSTEGTVDVTKPGGVLRTFTMKYFNTSNGYSHQILGSINNYVRAVRDGGEQRVYVADIAFTALVEIEG